MILRRFMKHFTDQNWFAVGLDVIVVIVGIFLGLQVQEAYKYSQERQQEHVYLKRLHDETIQLLNFTGITFDTLILVDEFHKIDALLQEILTVFDNRSPAIILGADHCQAIMTSHIYNDQTTYLPTLRELIASGQLPLILNEDIKVSLSQYTLAYDALKNQVNNINSAPLVLARKYPDLIILDKKMFNVRLSDQFQHICHFDKMRESVAFNNDLIDNTARMHAFSLTLIAAREMLNMVHSKLDDEIGIIHEGGTS